MPRILIDALSAVTGGAVTVSRGLSEHLAIGSPDWRFELLCSDRRAAPPAPPPNLEVRAMPQHTGLWRRTAWEQGVGPFHARRRGCDAWLLLSGFLPFLSGLPKLAVWQNAHIWTPPGPDLSHSLRRKIAVQKRIMRHSVLRADLNVFLSEDSLAACRREMEVPDERATVIPLGLGDEWLARGAPSGRAEREELLVMVGDLYVHKGFDLALRALALLLPAHPGLRLAIAGAVVDPEDRRALERLAQELGLSSRVDFLGRLPREELARLYERGAVYVAASRLESFGLTPLEAMACGLPVVSSRASATPEVCGSAATYFAEHRPEALAEALADLLSSQTRWQALQDAGLARARQFSWSPVAARYRVALEGLVTDRAA